MYPWNSISRKFAIDGPPEENKFGSLRLQHHACFFGFIVKSLQVFLASQNSQPLKI
jgi:hypothetical protein